MDILPLLAFIIIFFFGDPHIKVDDMQCLLGCTGVIGPCLSVRQAWILIGNAKICRSRRNVEY